jgi:hypothetical protein
MASPREIPDFDASDPDHVARRNSQKGAREVMRMEGLKSVMITRHGRLWMSDLLAFCGIGKSCYRGNSDTFFLEGQQNVGHRLLADITRHFKKEYMMMLEEGDVELQPKQEKKE